MRLRKLIIATHRDLGYLLAGITVIYAVSGLAVNHIHHWNPNYATSIESFDVGRLPDSETPVLAAQVLERLAIDETPISAVRMSADQLKIFLEGRSLTVTLPDGHVSIERISERPLLYQANYLHLNKGKGLWTWISDLYAVGLLLLALTGIFIIPGKKGLGGRGRWLLLAGVLTPILYLLLKVYS